MENYMVVFVENIPLSIEMDCVGLSECGHKKFGDIFNISFDSNKITKKIIKEIINVFEKDKSKRVLFILNNNKKIFCSNDFLYFSDGKNVLKFTQAIKLTKETK